IRDVVSDPSQVVWTGIQLTVEMPPLLSHQKLIGGDTTLWESFEIQMRKLITNEQGTLDTCVYNTIDAAREGSEIIFGKAALSQFASGILQASVGFDVGSALG